MLLKKIYVNNLLSHFCLNLLVAGDFNYPKIDWKHYSTPSSRKDLRSKFLECTRDCFFESFLSEPTCGRRSSQPTLIDLALTNNPDIIKLIKDKS